MFEADLPKRLRKFPLALGGKKISSILYVPSGFESVATGSQKRLEMVLGNSVVCPVLGGSVIGPSKHVHVAPSGEVFFQGRDQASQQTCT